MLFIAKYTTFTEVLNASLALMSSMFVQLVLLFKRTRFVNFLLEVSHFPRGLCACAKLLAPFGGNSLNLLNIHGYHTLQFNPPVTDNTHNK